MGFLDSIFTKENKAKFASAMNTFADEFAKGVQEVVDDVSEAVSNAANNSSSIATTTSSPSNTNYTYDSVPAGYEDLSAYAEVEEKLRAVFKQEFSQYEIREEVSPTTIGGTGEFMPYSFGVYENGTPKLFIMVIGNNTCRKRLYRWSKEEAERNNITMINFVGHFDNKIDYIINRLHQYL